MEKIHLSKDFKEFIELLNKNNVRYIVVGAYAVGLHGYVRFTGDLDIWVEPTPENAINLMSCIAEFGFGPFKDLSVEDFTKENTVVQFGYPPLRIDVMTSVSGIHFSECYEKRQLTVVDGTILPYLDLESLKKNKAATNRKKDLDDLENLPQ
ncbi:MAG: hypothetical protein HRU69_05140 [Flammeovirgaceae bacterium]|nr:MAG: hypothetical protein HRU69_05140 [Flammeovirgaceae bacterium]